MHPRLNKLVENLTEWCKVCATGVQSRLQDPVTSNQQNCELTDQTLRETIKGLCTIIGHENHATESSRVATKKVILTGAEKAEVLLMLLGKAYDPSGRVRPDGPRHDELMFPEPSYLPVTVPGAPHHLPARSMEKHIDKGFGCYGRA